MAKDKDEPILRVDVTPSQEGRGIDFRRVRGRYAGYTRARLAEYAKRLEASIYPEFSEVEQIELAGPTDRITLDEARSLTYRRVEFGEMLGPLWSTYWARVTVRIPADWRGQRVDLYWDSRSEALLWLDGRSVQGLNIGRNTARLVESAKGGERLTVYIEVACNRAFGAAEYAHPASQPYSLERCELCRFDPDAWALFHDFDLLRDLEADREPAQTPRSYGGIAHKIVRPALDTTWAGKLLHDLNRVCNLGDPEERSSWPTARAILSDMLAARNGDVTHELSAIGHAHIDTAWLWPIEETRRKCQRSFANAIALMDEYPEFMFACSQAYQYAVIEETDPELFTRIRAKVASGQWIPIGGSWVEPDCNLPSGEALSRQFLYGQRYFERVFGKRSRIFWNPDVFGYAGQLPQIMREAGMDRFLTQKLSWNRFTLPPHHSFLWRGIDGSEVLTHFPPADTYTGVASVEELRYHAANYKDADRSTHALYLFGYGDGGGGPDATMVERLQRARDLLGVPRSTMRGPEEFFDLLEDDRGNFATIEGELYFEYHRGTYTSQADVKKLNRAVEGRLQNLEFLATASMLDGQITPTRDEVERLWRTLLVNQFHDILPGSSIGEVYTRTRRELSETVEAVDGLTRGLLDDMFTSDVKHTPTPINTIGFKRDEVTQGPDGSLHFVILPPFSAGQVSTTEERVTLVESGTGEIRLQNGRLTAILTKAGGVRSLLHHATEREALADEGNRIVLYSDRPTAFEAWDIDPFALETGYEAMPATACRVRASGPLRAEVHFERRLGTKSKMSQTIRLDAASDYLEFDTTIDWHERHILAKVIFPLACKATRASYETMFGAVERPTHANTDADLAQYEVPGHRWADLSEPGFGVSLLNDARYGYSTFESLMGLSLLRGTTSPDMHADIGEHHFRYALFPHTGDWRAANTVGKAASFNRAILWATGAPPGVLAQSLVVTSEPNVVVDTIKPSEDGDGWVVRLYESVGAHTNSRLGFGVPVRSVHHSNTMEDRLGSLLIKDRCCMIVLRPFQIATLRITS